MADGRTDRQTYDSQDRASVAASRGKTRFVLDTSCVRQGAWRSGAKVWASQLLSTGRGSTTDRDAAVNDYR